MSVYGLINEKIKINNMEILINWIRIIINIWLLVMIYGETGIYTTILLSLISITNEVKIYNKRQKKPVIKNDSDLIKESKWQEKIKEMQNRKK